MNRRLVSVTLAISMLCSALPVFAQQETPTLDLNNVIGNTQISYNLDNISTLNTSIIECTSMENDTSIYSRSIVSDVQAYSREEATITPELELPQTENVVIPANRIEQTPGGWVSSNEVDDEDLILIEQERAEENEEYSVSSENDANSISTMSVNNSSISNDSLYRISNINSKDAFALQNQTGRTNFIGDNIGEEYIDPMTGNLVVTETDLVLPGIDGLDLNLSRYYSLAQAELYTKSANLVTTPKQFVLEDGMYIVTEQVYDWETQQTSTYYYPYFTLDAAKLRVEEIESRDTCDGRYSYNAWWELSDEGDIITIDYYYNSELNSVSYQRMRNDLGAGWSWSFPSVQTIKQDYEDEDEMPSALYYHDGKGNVMEVKWDNLNGCWFDNYVGKDITFEIYYDYNSSICDSTRIDYVVDDSDGTKYYFGPHGEIRTIMDLYGNKITFDYDEKDFYGASDMPVISRITDTIGRIIDFDYDADGNYEYINITVTSPLDNERSLTLSYKKRMIDVYSAIETKDENGNYIEVEREFVSTEPFLESFTNSLGEKTSYYPAIVDGERSYTQQIQFTFADKSFESDYVYNTSGYKKNLIYLLGNIVRPHSNTYYCYDSCERNLGHSGISEAFRVEERGDDLLVILDSNNQIIDGYSSNVIEYEYSLDYTGIGRFHSIESIPEDRYVARTKEYRENETYIREFYKKGGAVLEKEEQVIYNNPVGNNLDVTYLVESYLQKQPIRTKITYKNGTEYTYDSYIQNSINTQQNKSYGKILMQTEEVDYNTVIGSDREKHATTYTYDEETGFLLTKSWYKSNYTKCTERITYNSDNRVASISLADGTTTTYSYEYTNGHVSKVTTTTQNDEGTTVIEELYTSATAYSLPSTIIKTVTDSENTTVNTTTYTYDMLLGVVKSSTDDDGNTTYYEYDNLGRPTRIIHPKYSTFSSFGLKDIEILPVEDITYQTLWREYDNVSDGEIMSSQYVRNILTYYDVTDRNYSYSANANFGDYGAFFRNQEENYYLGTGEVIESNVFEDNGTVLNTMYYYNTDNNTITVVNANGDRTITQYDGMGREVKVTDEFNNQHIMEYNISSDGVGFKAQSYFIPSTEATVKENIVEYKYDRLQRILSKKGYIEYPDSYVEVEYEYDLAGNVIGLIDANKNLNEDGYTQSNTYDKRNRITSSKNANNEVLRYVYDNAGNIKKQTITDSSGNQSILYQRSYDGDGKMISDTDNAGNSNIYCYDEFGQLIELTDKDDKYYIAEYDELGRQNVDTHVKPGATMTARNSCIANPHGPDYLFDYKGVYVPDSGNYGIYDIQNTEYSYSLTGRLLSQINSYGYYTGFDNVSYETYSEYTYDEMGHVTSASHGTYNEAIDSLFKGTTHYEYDKSRVSKVQLNGSSTKNTSDNVNARYEYYPDGKLKTITFPTLTDNTVLKTEYAYDGLSRVTSITNYKGTQILSSYGYTYDSNGNILTVNETVGNEQDTINYGYDKLNRIATVSGTKGADSYYEYDARGNRKANYEEKDFLAETSAEFRYNEEDNLYYANVGSDITKIDYSSNGYRYVKQINTQMPEYYIYDLNGRLVAVSELIYMNIEGNRQVVMHPTKLYIWGPDRVLAQIDILSGNSYYYIYNGHGDVVQIVDTSGNIVNSYDYDVWGNFLKKEETIENHFTYFGQTYDEETGLYYLRARYYDPSTGRFTQQDPAEDGYNWYVYGNQNPVMYIDSEGEAASWIAIGGAVGACIVDGLITGGIYKWNGKAFGAGFINGFVSCLGTEIGVAVGATTGNPAGVYAGTIIGNCIGSAAGSLAEDLTYNKNKSAEEIAKSAAQSAATGIIAGVGSSYFKYAIDLANEAGSAAKTLMQYDERFGKALQIFFDELATILGAQ